MGEGQIGREDTCTGAQGSELGETADGDTRTSRVPHADTWTLKEMAEEISQMRTGPEATTQGMGAQDSGGGAHDRQHCGPLDRGGHKKGGAGGDGGTMATAAATDIEGD